MSAFEVDADSWMEELGAPMVEEKAQGNISEPRLDMAMRVQTLTHTYTVSTGALHCRDSKKKKKKNNNNNNKTQSNRAEQTQSSECKQKLQEPEILTAGGLDLIS